MIKPIKAKTVKNMNLDAIPYQNVWGHWVWRMNESIPEAPRWPGLKSPEWALKPIVHDGTWCWTD